MKKFLLLLSVALSVTAGYAETRTVKTYYPVQNNCINNYRNIAEYNYNKLRDMEYEIFGRNYDGQNIISRVERLEDTIFSRQYPDSTLEQRINNLIYSYKQNNSITNSKSVRLKNIVNGLSSAFFGSPTGYTPPLTGSYNDPYYSWGSNGFGQHYGSYSDYYDRNGWQGYSKNTGSNSGVQIID